MNDPRDQDMNKRAAREAGLGADFHAPLAPRDATAVGGIDTRDAATRTPDMRAADSRAARILVLATIAGTFLVAGGIEWSGWQIVYRLGDPSTVPTPGILGVPSIQWALGTVRNAALALGVGIGGAAVAMLFPWSRKRPWRAAATGFALGAASALTALAALTIWAP